MSLQALTERFTKFQMKERRLITFAAVVGTLLLGYNFFIDPALRGAAASNSQLEQQNKEMAELQNSLPILRQQAGDPDARLRADISNTNQQLAALDVELQQYAHLLVKPSQMPRLLQDMLARHRGLELVGLKTMAAAPLLPPKKPEVVPGAANSANAAMPAQPAGAKPPPPPGGIYRHGLEITVAGSYTELLAYAAELQRISPRPLWSGLSLKVVEYPRSELTFTLYTLSLDLPWLAV